jgi:hypothetical protein
MAKDNTIDLIKAARLLVLKDIHSKHRATLSRIENKSREKNEGIKVLRVLVSGDDWGLYTYEAYQELRLTMSSGDYGCHQARTEFVEDYSNVTTLDDMNNEAGEL